jgi:exosortase C (VPDSG-CTERM-specific)
VPIPGILMDGIETFLQHGSAAVAHALFSLSGAPFARDGLVFQLPGISLTVAPECSGIHSSLILFITSLLAGHLFLRTPWKRTVLALAVVPLALIRNGARIFTIGELCVHIGPEMINSAIHRHGGPWFFLLSLIPFFFLLLLLQKSDRARDAMGSKNPGI